MSPLKNSAIRIRPLRLSDAVRGLFATLESLSASPRLSRAQVRRVVAANGPRCRTFVAVNGEAIVGTVTLVVYQRFARRGGKVGFLECLAVRRGFEGRGIGTALVQRALAAAHAARCYKAVLTCRKGLIPFYRRCGFRAHGVAMRVESP